MILRLFGRDSREQIRGLIGCAFLLVLACILFLVVFQPEYGEQVRTHTLNMDIITVLVSLATLFAGYLAGDMGGQNQE